MTKILYFNANKVHMILYEVDEIIKLNDELDNGLSSYYYLFLLIRAGQDIINYEFLTKFIILFYNKINNKENKFYNFISYIIIIELINNFRNCGLFDESVDGDLISKIEKESREYIKNNINIFLDIKADITEINIYNKNLDEIIPINSSFICWKSENNIFSFSKYFFKDSLLFKTLNFFELIQ